MNAEVGRKLKINAGMANHFAVADAELISRTMIEPSDDYDFWDCVIEISWKDDTPWFGTNPHFLIQTILAYHSHFIDECVWLDDKAIKDDVDTVIVEHADKIMDKGGSIRLRVVYRRMHYRDRIAEKA